MSTLKQLSRFNVCLIRNLLLNEEMLKGRGRDTRGVMSPTPGHPTMRLTGLASPTPGHLTIRSGQASPTPGHTAIRSPGLGNRPGQQQRALPARPEPDYEVVEFPSDQYVNAKLQPPPPPPPRPPTGKFFITYLFKTVNSLLCLVGR